MEPAILVLLVAAGIWHGSASLTLDPNVTAMIVNKGAPVNLRCSGDFSVEWVSTRHNRIVNSTGTTSTLSITSASYRDTGTYQCAYTNSSDMERASVHLFVRDPEKVWYVPSINVRVSEGRDAQLPCLITDPEYGSNVTLLKDDNSPVLPGTEFSFSPRDGVTIYSVQQAHKGYYMCGALINGKVKRSSKIRLIVPKATVKPLSVTVEQKDHVRIQGEIFQITCNVISPSHKYNVKWLHPAQNVTTTTNINFEDGDYYISVTLYIPAVTIGDSGRYSCVANNSVGSSNSSTVLQVVERGYVRLLPMQNSSHEVKLGGNLELRVLIEAYPRLSNWSWTHENPSQHSVSALPNNQMVPGNNRYNNTLSLNRLKEDERGLYTFYAANDAANASVTFSITLKFPPEVHHVGMVFNDSTSHHCIASGYPAPHIEWYQCPGPADRCGQGRTLIRNDTNPWVISKLPFGKVKIESILQIKEFEYNVTFCCWAINSEGNDSQMHSVVPLPEKIRMLPHELFNPILSTSVGILVLLLLLLLFLLYKYNQKPKYQVRWKIIEACEGNNYIFIDPTQLPYNEKWEFPRNNLQFGKILGAGAFGKVVEATAFGLGKEDTVLKVAVKMLKSTAHTDEQEALMSELKIMSHLGHHENIVNLLGACTYGGPILVITEYCRYGDLLNFLRKNAESIIIQDSSLDSSLDSTADYKNIYLEKKYVRSDSGFASQCLETYVEMRPVPSDAMPAGGKLQGKNAEEEQDTRPLDLYDLLQFSNQVAQGMAFLASKNCIHRDLAARNVLVTHGRVAKICDFGLARDIMNDSNYVVKGNARLPVKWMAPESIFDCIYTVQSDVWSYGILLWEIFSLGKSPYPGMLVNSKFYSMVKQGYQMARPDFAPMEMYRIMQACWNLQPTRRPTFDQICHFIQKQLDANKEQDYTNLPSSSEEDSVSEPSGCCEESCDQAESSQPLLKSNNYQFC
ncbi:macrophage colony-stimulating factor 1 receptor isoform X1 [Mauremys reevesii]|uniref:macrophage colony-stimulating factor 1 receptor isoform X1 n=1 Tax=Mauremys reevesii TaxID=260615 RepID=UPI00193ED31D|nr:macrophage colony-stimulating factor 1 receptor isoform X1 [Mauremys reevesii]